MAFPPDFLEELRARLPLSDIVGKRMKLARAGREHTAPCPFHRERTPSFTVSDHKGFFHCFGCGAHGDVIGFVMRFDHLTFPEAVETLAGQAGLAMPRTAPEERRRFEREKGLHEAIEAATVWFERQLYQPAGAAALAYLRGRGLDDEAIAAFRLGYAPHDGAALRQTLERAGFGADLLVEAGLVRRPDDGRTPYSFFRHRVLFPVSDRRGRVVAFGGRLIEGEGPKYINTGETPLFHKGQLLYGLSRARQAAAENHPVLVVEGYMDVIALVRAGWPGAVAPLGTALTESQLEAVWKLIPGREKYPVLCFDGDNAGQRAAWRAVERALPLLKPDQSVRVAYLPKGEDPDSLIRARGVGAMHSILARTRSLAEVLWEMETAGRDFTTPEARAGLEAALQTRVEAIADRTLQFQFRNEMRQRLRQAFWVSARPAAAGARPGFGGGGRAGGPGGRRGPGRPGGAPQPVPPPQRPKNFDHRRIRIFLAALINHPVLLDEFHEPLAALAIQEPELDALRRALLAEAAAGGDGLEATALRTRLAAVAGRACLEDVLSESTYTNAPFTRPDTELAAVRYGLADAQATLSRRQVARELEQAGQHCSRDLSAQTFHRVASLRVPHDTPIHDPDDPE